MPKIERKYLAHFLDAKFGVKTQGEETYAPNYTRLGKDLEEYNEELNPDVEVNKNILGEQNVVHNGYEVQSEVDPFYAYSGDPLFERLAKIANERLTGDDCMTTKVDVLLNSDGTVSVHQILSFYHKCDKNRIPYFLEKVKFQRTECCILSRRH